MIERKLMNFLFLNHILEACENIIEFLKDIDFEAFNKSRLIQSAVIRELGIIGEARYYKTRKFKISINT